MGAPSSLVRQSVFLAALGAVVFWACPQEAKGWVMLLAVLSVGFFVAVSLFRHGQIRRLAAEVDEVLHGGRVVDFSNCREGDVAVLANELGKMTARLMRTSEQLACERNALADALADVSHQIRTPLTAITLMLPSIERLEDKGERKRALRELETMVERLSWLVTTLLKIAKVDAGALPLERQEVKAFAMVERAIAPLALNADIRGITLSVEGDTQALFRGDALWSAEAVENIVKNSLEHTDEGGRVTISVAEDALSTTIDIADSGTGIDPQDLPHIFERFYRGGDGQSEKSDSVRHPEGFGIGLSLALALVSAQGGTLRAFNNTEGGTRFTIAFPKVVV